MKGFEGVEFCKDGFVRVAPEKVRRLTDPNAGRTREDVERMKASLLANGQLNSAAGYLDPDLGTVILVDGSTRAQAMVELNDEYSGTRSWELEVKLVDPELYGSEEEGAKESLVVGLAANLDRGTMSGMSIAHALQTLRDKGMEVEDIARKLSRSPAWVREHLKLLSNASPEVQRAVENGKIASSTAAKLTKLEPEQQGKVLERLLQEGDSMVTRDAVTQAVKEEMGQDEGKRVPAATMTEWRGIVEQWVESPQALPAAFWELASILQQFNVGKIRKESTLRGKIQEILEAVEKGTLSGTEIAEEAIEEEKPKKKRGKKAEKEKEG